MIELLMILTFSAPDLEAIENAYAGSLDYQVSERGQVSADLAEAWGTPAMQGQDYLLMQPEAGGEYYLRFIENEPVAGYGPMTSFGWSAAELLVEDPSELATKLRKEGSGFKIVGEPRPLSATSKIWAMQVVGPADEVLYLTRLPPAGSGAEGSELGSARSYVDRPFIVVVGGPDVELMREFYIETFGLEASEASETRITVLNKAYGLDIETVHPISLTRWSSDLAVEMDEYPAMATTRAHRWKSLPPGLAMVTMTVPDLDRYKALWLAEPRRIDKSPYQGSRIVNILGAAGELIELIEPKK